MRTPEEYYDYVWKKKFPNIILDSDFVNEIINLSIMSAQKDAYNQALDDLFEYQLLNRFLETNQTMIDNLKIK